MIGSSLTTQRLVRFMVGMLAVGLLAQQSVAAGPPAPPSGGPRPPTGNLETITKTLVIRPQPGQLATASSTHSSQADVYYVPFPVSCPPSTRGTGEATTLPDEIIVGFSNYYDAGTDPLPCWEKSNYIIRGNVYFSLDTYASIKSKWLVKARLTYHLRRSDVGGDDPGTYGVDHPVSCAGHLDLASASPYTGSWADMTKTAPFATLPALREGSTGNFAIDVTDAVNRMASYPDFYHGFIFSGDESMGEDNRTCLSHYTNFQLTLEYAPGKV